MLYATYKDDGGPRSPALLSWRSRAEKFGNPWSTHPNANGRSGEVFKFRMKKTLQHLPNNLSEWWQICQALKKKKKKE